MESEYELRRQKIMTDLRHDIKMNPEYNFEPILEDMINSGVLTKEEGDDILFQTREQIKILNSIQALLNESEANINTNVRIDDYFSIIQNVNNQFVKKNDEVLNENYILNFNYTKNLYLDNDFQGVRLFDASQFNNSTEAKLKSKLPKFNGIISPRYYKLSPDHDYKTCITKITFGFPILLRQVIVNVINCKTVKYNDHFEYKLYNRLLDFDFEIFAVNFNLLLERIKLPNSILSEIENKLSNQPKFLRFLNIINKPLINEIIRLHTLEFELYFYCSVVMYYLNTFKVDVSSLSSDNILKRVSEYSSISLKSSKHQTLILRIVKKYYQTRKNDNLGSLNSFALNQVPNYLIDFSAVEKFNIQNCSNRWQNLTFASELKRKHENRPISFNISHDYILRIKEYLNIKEKENQALAEFDTWASMDGHKFEHEILRFFTKFLGLKGEVTPGSGDFGIDIILEKKIAIQCKNHSTKISPGAIRDFITACKDRGFTKMIFVSREGISEESSRLARAFGVKLLSIPTVIDIIQGRINGDEIMEYLIGEI